MGEKKSVLCICLGGFFWCCVFGLNKNVFFLFLLVVFWFDKTCFPAFFWFRALKGTVLFSSLSCSFGFNVVCVFSF